MWLLLSCSPASLTLGTDSTPLPTIQDSDPVVESEPIDSIGPADTSPEDSDAPDGPDELLYEPARVLQLTITLTNQNYNALRRDGHSFVDAELSYGDWTGPVQIHIKGSSTWQEIDAKPSLVVDVDNLAPGFEFMGEEKFYLHNQCYDPSMYSEQLSYNFYREQGYPASRTNFARLTLNGEDYGFYSIVEPHEDDFLRIWFDDPNGNLYENAEAYCDVWDLRCMEVEENDEGNDDALRALGAAAQNGAFSEVRPLVDYSRFIEHMALEASISHWDSYSYDLSNYQLYHEPTTDQWTLLTQSMDLDFGWRPWSFPTCGRYAMDPGTYTMGRLASLCAEDSSCHADFVDAVERIADALESWDGAARVRELDRLYGAEVRSDPRRYYGNSDYSAHISCLEDFFESRPAQLREWAASAR